MTEMLFEGDSEVRIWLAKADLKSRLVRGYP